MATAAQITANQLNAQQSTGPRTAAGKARSAQNALRHGLTARHLVIGDDEREEFDALQSALLEELAPEGAVETVVFHDLLHASWNLHRFRRIEAQASADLGDPLAAALLDRLARHQARTRRACYRALRELRILQTDRALRAVKLDEETEAEVPALVDINELTKQSRSEVDAAAFEQAVNMMNYETGIYTRCARAAQAARTQQKPAPENGELPASLRL